ncbi:response regulator [candidate division KSB1 bacterium]|nr:response regulator [candidate division KSB1 bacterium]
MKSQKKILLIDDEKIVRKMLTAFLSPYFEVHNAENALKAFELILNLKIDSFPAELKQMEDYFLSIIPPDTFQPSQLKLIPDLIIVDVKMPYINGFCFLQIIRHYLPDVPAFVITGYDAENYDHEVIKLNITELLSKPFSPMLLLEKLSQTLHVELANRKTALNE